MKGRPWKGMDHPFLPLWLGLMMWAFGAGSVAADTDLYLQMAKATAVPRAQIAKGEEPGGSEKVSSNLAILSAIILEQAGPTSASIIIQGSQSLQSYESFALPDPPRLVIDVPYAQHAITSSPTPGPESLIKGIRSSQYKDSPIKVVRFVFDLTSPSSYRVEPSGNQLKVVLGEGQGAEASGSTSAPEAPAAVGKVTKIDYQTAKGKGRVLVSTEGKVKWEVVKISHPPSLALDIHPAEIMTPATQPLDVRLLPGQVEQIKAIQYQTEPEKIVRVVAELKGTARYQVLQDRKGITMDILPGTAEAPAMAAPTAPPPMEAAAAPPDEVQPSSGGAKRVSMDFKDADINNLLRILAEVSGANIVAGSEVKGNVTVRLTNVPWDQAMEMILKINSFGYVKEGNIYRVTKLEAIQKEKEDLRKREAEARATEATAKREKIALAPLEQHILSVNYVSAEKLLENLQPLGSLDPETGKARGKLTIHTETKSIIINDTAEAIGKMKEMASRLDIRTPQVMIEARIITVREGYSQALGIQWGGAYKADLNGSSDLVIAGSNPYSMTTPNPATGNPSMGAPGFGSSVGSYIMNLPASPIGGGPIAGAISLGYIGSRLLLDARLTLAESEAQAKTLSSPKVTTLDNKEAEIKSGVQIPFTTVDPSSGRLTISFQEAYLRLKVKPHVTSDRRINMEIEAENNTVGQSYPTGVGDVISIDKRMAKTELLAENGSTVVLGGLYVSTEQWSEDRIPFLGKIPILGWLFKRRAVNPTRQELLIFITPTILEEQKT